MKLLTIWTGISLTNNICPYKVASQHTKLHFVLLLRLRKIVMHTKNRHNQEIFMFRELKSFNCEYER